MNACVFVWYDEGREEVAKWERESYIEMARAYLGG